ncbi:MAG: ribosome small subunit-dependent GTPase A [Lachnospiraceae bacterium]|nr:ribosome small subunit-dependent GTPase A [Lachnospiraceae bacterium]
MQGKIIKGIGGFYYVHDGRETVVECRARGNFRQQAVKPLVGDDVLIRLTDEDPGSGYIEQMLPRRNLLIRPAVANVDQALILISLEQPAFQPVLLDTFLIWMGWQEVPVIIGMNKADLGDKETEESIRRSYEGAGYRVCSFSAFTGQGLETLASMLRGSSTVLAGVSGVGKSTLLNRLLPEASMKTGALSRKLGRGRHTTRHSEIFCWDKDSYLCDTPGFSSLELPEMEAGQLETCYPEFEPYRAQCFFRDCLHFREKDCCVREAVQNGEIPRMRYENYCRFTEELKNRRKY